MEPLLLPGGGVTRGRWLTSLNLSFLSCKMGPVIPTLQGGHEDPVS